MAKVDVIQTSFASGEIGPSLYGRTDVVQYANACALVENFLPRPYGSVISAPGSTYVATVSDSTLNTRLIKFVFNRTDSYVIEMGDKYMRFFTNRGQVVTPAGTEDLSSLTSSTIAHYKLNDNAATTVVLDTSGDHDGTCSTLTTTVHTTGIVGTGCFDFDGRYSVEIPNHADFNFSDTIGGVPFSLVAWVYVTATGNYQDIIAKRDTNKTDWYFIFNLTNQLAFVMYDDNNDKAARIISGDTISEGWHLLCASYDGRGGSSASDGLSLSVDGVVLSNVTKSTDAGYAYSANNTAPVVIGAMLSGGVPSRWFADKIDEVSIFNKVLTPVEIASLYTSSAYQLTTVYEEDEIWDVQYTQLNDVIWLTHPNHPTQKLVRTSANEWAISNFAFKGGPFLDDNTTATTLTASATTGTVNITVTPTNANLFTLSTGTLGHKNTYWKRGGLAQTNTTTFLQEEGYVQLTDIINSYTATATVIKNLKSTAATTKWAEGAWSAVRGYPARVAFHERRLWFARTSYEPQRIWGSRVFLYDDFTLDTEGDDDGLNLALASNESNEIQWLVSTKSLIAGTYGGAFVINSGSTEPITPSNANSTDEINTGASDIVPNKIGNFLYYIQRFGRKLRELFYFWDLDTYKTIDKTILAPHILGDGVVDMDYQQNPDTILYCVLTNGTLATFTREVDQEVQAWARQTTAGTYTSIAIIPSQSANYDEAWVIVERWINGSQKKYVEYFENIEVPDRQDACIYLHSALTYDAYSVSSSTNCSISLQNTSGTITLTSSTTYFAAGSVNKKIRAIDADGTTLGECVITAYTSGTIVTASITTVFTTTAYSAGYWGMSTASVAGLSHLEAKTVGILADGITESITKTVASGAVTLGSQYFVIHVGLSYNQILYTLPKEAGSARGTAQGKLQRINELAFKLNRSYQGFKIGETSASLDRVSEMITPSVTTLYTGIIGNLPFRGNWSRGAQMYIKNEDPLPIEILSIASTLTTEDK